MATVSEPVALEALEGIWRLPCRIPILTIDLFAEAGGIYTCLRPFPRRLQPTWVKTRSETLRLDSLFAGAQYFNCLRGAEGVYCVCYGTRSSAAHSISFTKKVRRVCTVMCIPTHNYQVSCPTGCGHWKKASSTSLTTLTSGSRLAARSLSTRSPSSHGAIGGGTQV